MQLSGTHNTELQKYQLKINHLSNSNNLKGSAHCSRELLLDNNLQEHYEQP